MDTPNRRWACGGLIALVILGVTSATGQNPHEPFSLGETLTYDVMWTVFRAGEVTATLGAIHRGQSDDYEITATARSEGFVSLLFNVDNVFRATASSQTLCSGGIVKKVSEGRRRKDTQILFDYNRKLAVLNERDLTQPNAPPKHAENEIPPCVEDVVTAFYYLRRQHLEVGHTVEMPVNDGAKTQRVIVDVQAKDKVQTAMGTFDAWRVEPKVFNGLFKRKGSILIWLSADDKQLPLRIKATFAAGSLTGTLRSVTYPKPGAAPTAR